MSLRANPTAIGLFMIGGLVIAVASTAVLAGNSWFQKRTKFVSFFHETVNGLEVGAPVKFQGAPIGTVTNIGIQIDNRNKTFQVPVEYQIDITKLTTAVGTYVDLAKRPVLLAQVENGLRAQLQMESIVTGMLYVELQYREGAKPAEFEPRVTKWPEIPTSPSLMAALGTGAGSIVGDIVKVLFKVNEMLAAIDIPSINKAVVASAQSVQRLVDAPEIRAAFSQIPGVTAQLNRTMASVETLAGKSSAAIEPVTVELTASAKEMNATLQSLRKTIDDMRGLLSTDAGLGFGLESALASMKDAANALSLLVKSLEQNPDMLLRGKKPSGGR